MNTVALTQLYVNRAITLLVGVCALSVFFYATFLLLTVSHAASQTATERQIQKLASQVNNMETQYLVATKNITPERALVLGFVAPSQNQISTVFASEGASVLSLR